MKKIAIFSVAVLMIGGITLTSCKKYEDGPSITLLTKKMRLDGEWKVDSYYINDVDKTTDYRNFIESETLTMDKSGSWTYSATDAVFHQTSSNVGTWTFINDKEDLQMTNTSNNSVETWHILRLTNKEFWYDITDSNGNRTEYHMETK